MPPRILPIVATGLVAAALAVAGCGRSTPSPTGTAPGAPANGQVLPVPTNPITTTGKASTLTITKALVENNVSPQTGKGVTDHLEVALMNSGSTPLSQIEVYYKVSDPAKKLSEGYFAKLSGVTIAPGATEIVNFDQAKGSGHFPVNKFGLYYTDKNALVVDVTAASPDARPTTFTVKKDAGGAEAGVE